MNLTDQPGKEPRPAPAEWRTTRELDLGGPEDPPRRPGRLFKHQDGRIGRTFTGSEWLDGKLAITVMDVQEVQLPDGGGKVTLPLGAKPGPRALWNPTLVTFIGFID